MADSSFGGAAFDVESQDGALQRELQADVSVRHIPGGNTSYLDLAGQQPRKVTLACFFASGAAYAALEGLVGSQGTLAYVDGTYTAVLLSLRRAWVNLGTGRETRAEATFVLL